MVVLNGKFLGTRAHQTNYIAVIPVVGSCVMKNHRDFSVINRV